jgi:steroid delta-isomerase-like uncharacterized protein
MKNALQLCPVLLFAALLFSQCAASRKLKTAHKNEEIVRRWFEEGWNHNRNDELIPLTFAPDWSDGNPIRANQVDSLEGVREMVKFYRHAFSETHFTITHLFANERYVSLRYEVTARHVSDAFGIPMTGKTFTSSAILIYEMENGLIKKSWQELDLMGIIKQLKTGEN